jgi:hypothetical protein
MGGHSRELFKGTVYLFLNDVTNFATSNSAASSTAFASPTALASKITGVNGIAVPEEGKTLFGSQDISQEVGLAISNTNDVSFKVNYTPAQ